MMLQVARCRVDNQEERAGGGGGQPHNDVRMTKRRGGAHRTAGYVGKEDEARRGGSSGEVCVMKQSPATALHKGTLWGGRAGAGQWGLWIWTFLLPTAFPVAASTHVPLKGHIRLFISRSNCAGTRAGVMTSGVTNLLCVPAFHLHSHRSGPTVRPGSLVSGAKHIGPTAPEWLGARAASNVILILPKNMNKCNLP